MLQKSKIRENNHKNIFNRETDAFLLTGRHPQDVAELEELLYYACRLPWRKAPPFVLRVRLILPRCQYLWLRWILHSNRNNGDLTRGLNLQVEENAKQPSQASCCQPDRGCSLAMKEGSPSCAFSMRRASRFAYLGQERGARNTRYKKAPHISW